MQYEFNDEHELLDHVHTHYSLEYMLESYFHREKLLSKMRSKPMPRLATDMLRFLLETYSEELIQDAIATMEDE